MPTRTRTKYLALACAFLASMTCFSHLQSIAYAEETTRVISKSGEGDRSRLIVYANGTAQLTETRRFKLPDGKVRLVVEDVSPQLRPETVLIQGAGLVVRAQSFRFDPLSRRRLLEESLGESVFVRYRGSEGEEIFKEGLLLSYVEGPVVRVGERIETPAPGDVLFTRLPEDLTAEPVLLAEIESDQSGDKELLLRYMTGGLSWQADYDASLDEKGENLDLRGFVTLTNQSGLSLEDVEVSFLAGDVGAGEPQPLARAAPVMAMAAEAAVVQDVEQIESRSFADRHLYDLPHKVSLARGESRQVRLFEAEGLKVKKRLRMMGLVFAGRGPEEIGPLNPEIVIELENKESTGLGRALPGGTLRVYQPASGNGEPIFVGAAPLPASAEGETLELAIGQAFDVTGRSRILSFQRISNTTGAYEMAQEVELANAQANDLTVELVGNLPRGWSMLEESAPHQKESANVIRWDLSVPAGGKVQLTYKIRVKP
ncbi:MAG: hypothetical protein R3245_07240 [Kiloniellales bacterium]|nr:hypothetical protein [Kiloniellales bacterium]